MVFDAFYFIIARAVSSIYFKSTTFYFRKSSEDIASPLPALPRDVGAEQELEPDERQRMLRSAANGSLSGNESGIGLEEGVNEMPAVAELRPLRDASRFAPNSTGKISKSRQSVV